MEHTHINKLVIPPSEEDLSRDTYGFSERLKKAEESSYEQVVNEVCNIFQQVKDDYKKLTDFVIILNYRTYGDIYPHAYYMMYHKFAQYAEVHLKGKELQYYYKETD